MKKGENRERKYYFFKSTVQKQKSKFLHPVTRKSQIKKNIFYLSSIQKTFIRFMSSYYCFCRVSIMFLKVKSSNDPCW